MLDKHARLRRYVTICSAVRRKFVGAGTSFVDLYCGPGRLRIRGTSEIVDGSAIAAATAAREARSGFTQIHVADIDSDAVSATVARLKNRHADTPIVAHVGPADETGPPDRSGTQALRIARGIP